jgi:hypothetical protein
MLATIFNRVFAAGGNYNRICPGVAPETRVIEAKPHVRDYPEVLNGSNRHRSIIAAKGPSRYQRSANERGFQSAQLLTCIR